MKSHLGWPTKPTVTLSDPAAYGSIDRFGNSVAVSGDTAVVSAFDSNVGGTAYIYVRGPGGWPTEPTTTLEDPAATSGDFFGDSVAVSEDALGNTVIIGAPASTSDDGAAYVYVERPSGWPTRPTATLPDPAATSGDEFGGSVAVVSGGATVVGAFGSNSGEGAAYLFRSAI